MSNPREKMIQRLIVVKDQIRQLSEFPNPSTLAERILLEHLQMEAVFIQDCIDEEIT